ncbi:MAG: VTT domain-containing protein [Terracidiphilus sp.]
MIPMPLPEHFLLTYGYLLLFGWVLVEQLGLPLPAMPVLLAAGALSADGSLNFAFALAAGLAASLLADSAWFWAGRRYSHKIFKLLCKLSFEPTVCIRRTQDSFGRRRALTLVIAKFIPGLATLAPPVAGQTGMSLADFLLYDGIGSVLWIGGLLTAGRFCGRMIALSPGLLDTLDRIAGLLLVLGIAGFFVVRVIRRRRSLRKLVEARLEPLELKQRLDQGEEIFIVDLRHPLELLPDPFTLPGAQHFSPEALAARHQEIPRDREIVLFCTCPSEASAAKTALTLQKLGIERVRPLRGGYDEWKRLGFPLDAVKPARAEV